MSVPEPTLSYADAWEARIYVGGREGYDGPEFELRRVLEAIAAFQVGHPDSTTVRVTATTYLYKNYVEHGYEVGLINYPRFPKDRYQLRSFAVGLAQHLLESLKQNRVSVVLPAENQTVLFTSPTAEVHPVSRGDDVPSLLKAINAGDDSAVDRLESLCRLVGRTFVADRIASGITHYRTKNRLLELRNYVVCGVFSACPKCSSQNTAVENHNPIWRDGDVICQDCRTYVRGYDAG